MISKLTLTNIQCHTKAVLSLSKGVNYFVGGTDKGKSATLRGMRWLLSNRPVNTSLMKMDTNSSSVQAITSDKHTVERKRTKTKNLYILDGKEKKGFGKDVPEEVQAVLPFLDSLQFQKQSEQYFLFGISSSTERAKEIEKYTDLTVISRAISKARGSLLSLNKEKEAVSELIRTTREEKNRLKGVKGLEALAERLGELEGQIKVITRVIGSLEDEASIILELSSKKRTLKALLSLGFENAEKVASSLKEEEQGVSELLQIEEGREVIRKAEGMLSVYEKFSVLIKGIYFDKIIPMERECKELEAELESFNRLGFFVRTCQKDLKTVEKQLADIKVCPTCGKKL